MSMIPVVDPWTFWTNGGKLAKIVISDDLHNPTHKYF